MDSLEIKIYGDEVLRKVCKPVEEITPELVNLAKKMLEAMYEAPGIGLAAPQIGKDIRLVVIDITHPDETDEREPHIMFNPSWEPEESSELVAYEEGCLSIPDVFCNVERPSTIKVRYTDEHGEAQEMRGVEGLLARCVQHEVDHLDGVLFVDKISQSDRILNQSKLKKMAKR
ncbi:MAG: peptide deformylase [Fibrobacter sp.]|jgi:peptide deformylase|nr:peptide deformylase [Fibrobacter sp.]